MSRLCLLAAVKQTNQTPYNFLHDENIWVIVFELSVVVGSLVVQLWCRGPSPLRHGPLHSSHPLRKDRFKSLTKGGY